MLPQNRRKTNIGVGIGIVLQVIGFLYLTKDIAILLGIILILISIPIFIWGCMNYAESKGHSKWVGLVGLAGLIGPIILIILPDQDRGSSVNQVQIYKIVGLISLMLGTGLLVFGRWLDDLDYASITREVYVVLEHPWPSVFMFSGICIALGGLVLMLHTKRP